MLAPTAVLTRAQAIFALPMSVGNTRIGVLDLYRDTAGGLADHTLMDALVGADAVIELLLAEILADGGDENPMLGSVMAAAIICCIARQCRRPGCAACSRGPSRGRPGAAACARIRRRTRSGRGGRRRSGPAAAVQRPGWSALRSR